MALTTEQLYDLADYIEYEKAKAWSEGFYVGYVENYTPLDIEDDQRVKDYADSRNRYKENINGRN